MSWSRAELAGASQGPCHRFEVLFQHVDAAGIVFFGRMFEYFHDAYVATLADAGHPLPDVLAEKRWLAPLVHAEADYLSPLRFGDTVDARVVRALVKGSKLVVGYRVSVGDRVAAVGHTVHIFCDMDTLERVDMPSDLAAYFRALGAPEAAQP